MTTLTKLRDNSRIVTLVLISVLCGIGYVVLRGDLDQGPLEWIDSFVPGAKAAFGFIVLAGAFDLLVLSPAVRWRRKRDRRKASAIEEISIVSEGGTQMSRWARGVIWVGDACFLYGIYCFYLIARTNVFEMEGWAAPILDQMVGSIAVKGWIIVIVLALAIDIATRAAIIAVKPGLIDSDDYALFHQKMNRIWSVLLGSVVLLTELMLMVSAMAV